MIYFGKFFGMSHGGRSPEREAEGQRELGEGRERRKVNKVLEDDRWTPAVVVGIEKGYKEWMGAVKLKIE